MPLSETGASNAKLTPLGKSYFEHYTHQRGGAFPVFRGGIGYQEGKGLSEILKTASEFLLPIAATAAQKFVESTSESLGKGKSLSHSTKGALKPTLMSAVDTIGDKIFQKGSGRKRKRAQIKRAGKKYFNKTPRARVYKGKKHPTKKSKYFLESLNF